MVPLRLVPNYFPAFLSSFIKMTQKLREKFALGQAARGTDRPRRVLKSQQHDTQMLPVCLSLALIICTTLGKQGKNRSFAFTFFEIDALGRKDGQTDRRTQLKTDMTQSTPLVILSKNICTLCGVSQICFCLLHIFAQSQSPF